MDATEPPAWEPMEEAPSPRRARSARSAQRVHKAPAPTMPATKPGQPLLRRTRDGSSCIPSQAMDESAHSMPAGRSREEESFRSAKERGHGCDTGSDQIHSKMPAWIRHAGKASCAV